MMRIPPVLLLLALTACGTQDADAPDDGDTLLSANDVEAQLGEAMAEGRFLEPGQWQSSLDVQKMPDMPADELATLREQVGNITNSICLSRADVAQPDARFFTGEDQDCTYERFTLDQGRIDARMTCTIQGEPQLMEMNGRYEPERYDITMRASSDPDAGPDMVMRITADRVGDCDEDAR